MTDTIRTLDQILALLADNTNGDISPQDLRDQTVTLNSFVVAAEAALRPYPSRAAFKAASIPIDIQSVAFMHDGLRLDFVRGAAPGAVASFDGQVWVPNGLATASHFGAIGDGGNRTSPTGTDNTAEIQAAFDWLGAGYRRWLTFMGDGRVYRVSGKSTFNAGGKDVGGITMLGPIRPDVQAGDAVELQHARGGQYRLWADGGGQDSTMSDADPVGLAQGFVINGVKEADFWIEGFAYKGRVSRFKESDFAGWGTSNNTVHVLKTGNVTPQTTHRCGQAIFCDANTAAVIRVEDMRTFWDEWGPIFRDCFDVYIQNCEGGHRFQTSMEFQGVGSVWIDMFGKGDESTPPNLDMLKFIDSPITGAKCFNIGIDRAFVVGGGVGIYAENVGDGDKNGIHIGMVYGRNNSVAAVQLHNCNGASFGIDSRLDQQGFILSGGCDRIRVNGEIQSSTDEGFTIESGVGGDIDLNGLAVRNCNNTAGSPTAADRGQVSIQTLGRVSMDKCVIENTADLSAFLIDVPSGNDLHVTGGSLAQVGGTRLFRNDPAFASNVKGYVTGEVGTNVNGKFEKFDDGTMICRGRFNLGARNSAGSGTSADPYRTSAVSLNYPRAFTEAPHVSLQAECGSPVVNARNMNISFASRTASQVTTVNAFAGAVSLGTDSTDVFCHITAIGRWK